jgi:hypothetical protein
MKNRNKRTGLLALAVLILVTITGSAAEAAFDFSGSYRNDMTMWQYAPPGAATAWRWGDQNILRLNFKEISPNLKVEGSFDLSLLAGENAEAYSKTLPSGQDNSFIWLDTRWVPLADTRKLYLSLFFDRWTLTVGRQIINYGVGYVFSPIDCFSTVNLQDIGLSRKGSDIMRVQVPLGDLAGIEGVTTININGTDSANAVKIFGNLRGYDVSLTAIYKKPQEEMIVGATFKGDLGLGIHGELVEHWNRQNNSQYFEGMAGVDYSFNDSKVLLLAEYYYNGNPVDPDLTLPESLPLNRTFWGPSYLFGQAQFIYDEIRSFNVNGIYNPMERSWVGTFQFLYNIRQNTNLLLHARYYAGDLNGMDSSNSPKAEYGAGVEVKF